jgi:hypothetical protein
MILKVKSNLHGEDGWLILGGVRDVSYSEELVETNYKGLLDNGALGDYLVFDCPHGPYRDNEPSYDPQDLDLKCRVVMVLCEDEKTVKVWFNDVAYLMNDNGKTVETIYGY